MSDPPGPDPNGPPLSIRLARAFRLAFRHDEMFRYALILGLIALVVALSSGHHAASIGRS